MIGRTLKHYKIESVIGRGGYRFVRNRKFRMLSSFTKKVASVQKT